MTLTERYNGAEGKQYWLCGYKEKRWYLSFSHWYLFYWKELAGLVQWQKLTVAQNYTFGKLLARNLIYNIGAVNFSSYQQQI